MPAPIQDVGTSRCVRSKLTSTVLELKISSTAFLTTFATTLDIVIKPIMPAIASMPIPCELGPRPMELHDRQFA